MRSESLIYTLILGNHMTMIHYFNSSLLADKISKKFEFQITSRKEQFALIFFIKIFQVFYFEESFYSISLAFERNKRNK